MLQQLPSNTPVYQPGSEPTDRETVLVAALALSCPRSDYGAPLMPILKEFFGLSDEEALSAIHLAGLSGFEGVVRELFETSGSVSS